MSLSNFIKKIDNHGEHSSDLGRTMLSCSETNRLLYTNDIQTFNYLYNNKFNHYSLELTISPKSSYLFSQECCGACGATSTKDTNQQVKIIKDSIEKIIDKYNINILGVIELYKDGVTPHCHAVINNQSQSKIYKLKKYIKEYYNLPSRVIHISPVVNRIKFREYLSKDPYGEFFYYDKNNEKPIQTIEKEIQTIKSKYQCNCVFVQCKNCTEIEATIGV